MDFINNAALEKENIKDYIATVPCVRKCAICGGLKLCSHVHKTKDVGLCTSGCARALGIRDFVNHKTSDPVLIGTTCKRCERAQAHTIYEFNGEKIPLCLDCSGHLVEQIRGGLRL